MRITLARILVYGHVRDQSTRLVPNRAGSAADAHVGPTLEDLVFTAFKSSQLTHECPCNVGIDLAVQQDRTLRVLQHRRHLL